MHITFDGIAGNVAAQIAASRFEIAPHIARIRAVLDEGGYAAPEASLNVPFDTALHDAVERLVVQLKTPRLRFVFLVGIGGSNLGAKAIYDAHFAARDATMHTDTRLICVDTVDEALLLAVKSCIATLMSVDEYVVVSVSKSGGTTETIMNTEIIMNELASRLGPAPDRLVVISDVGSPFITAAKAWGAHTLAIPKMVGGRYSVFSAVGLVPLALCGIDIRSLTSGAEKACADASHVDIMHNSVATAALLSVHAYREGKHIHDMFVFHPGLESLGKWWRQLVGESLGKSLKVSSATQVGITPTVSVGSTDLHSVGQLYLGGPSDKLTLFVYTTASHGLRMPSKRLFPDLVEVVTNATVTNVLLAILQGTKAAFVARKRPFIVVELTTLSAFELGYCMQSLMIQTIYMGDLLGVNAFDQPDVEAYKQVTKELLGNSK